MCIPHVAAKFVPRILTADQKQQRVAQQFLAKNKIAVILLPPYSPDLAPCDFFLFPKMKMKLKGRRFDTTEEIQAETQEVLDTLTERDFQETFQKWRRRWDRCLHAGGTTPRVTAADRTYGKFYDFYNVSPENFGSTLVNIQFVHHREFIVLHLKRPIDECRTRKIILVYS